MHYNVMVSCPRGVESLLLEECQEMGLADIRLTSSGVRASGGLEAIYRLVLHTRLANRVYIPLLKARVSDGASIYQACINYDWSQWIEEPKTLWINFHGTNQHIKNTMYGAQCIKDAIVDSYRNQNKMRPSVDKNQPMLSIHTHLKRDEMTISLDLIGKSLHQRAYRKHAGQAPMKENLAAAILLRSGWHHQMAKDSVLLDPCCGSGTLLIEALLMMLDMAPGLLHDGFSFMHFKNHDEELWNTLVNEAQLRVEQAKKTFKGKFIGVDKHNSMIQQACQNLTALGLEEYISFQACDVQDLSIESQWRERPGFIITNPPYGHRLGENLKLQGLYQSIGDLIVHQCQNWTLGVLTTDPLLAKSTGLVYDRRYQFYNGPLECHLYLFNTSTMKRSQAMEKELSNAEEVLFNRLTKNKKRLSKWLSKNNIQCYRLYDADIPEYAVAIDVYEDYIHVQEYLAPKTISPQAAQKRMMEVYRVLLKFFATDEDKISIKQRSRQRGKAQYTKSNHPSLAVNVHEGRATFKVELGHYLDTGLFLDHRWIRQKIYSQAKGMRFLNLFCYTATASVHAALGGAETTYSVDLSKTYIEWSKENFRLNKIPLRQHHFIQEDCFSFLKKNKQRFDMIFLDPPTFSNSKRMQGTLDIQRDHPALIRLAMRSLSPQGVLYFSNNFQKFKIDPQVGESFAVKDISSMSIQDDFKRRPNIHCLFEIRHQ